MVADCGGGTVDLTVHQLEQPHGTLKELYKASGEYTHEYPCHQALTGPSIVPWWPIWQQHPLCLLPCCRRPLWRSRGGPGL